MKHSAQISDEPDVVALLNELLNDLPTLIAGASRAQKRRLLIALEELLPGKESMLNSWLTVLLKTNDIPSSIDKASEHKRRRLLMLLEDLQPSDQRIHARKPCSIAVTLDGLLIDTISNISGGGVFIETSAAFEPGKHVRLEFKFPDEKEPVRVPGQIAWRSPEGIGVKFTAVSKDVQKIIESL